jgi:predicted aspartyl protease
VSIEFPLAYKHTPIGPVTDPRIPLGVRTVAGDVTYRFLVDTGADLSVAPRSLAVQVGLDWDSLPEAGVLAVGRGAVQARLGSLSVRIDTTQLSLRCLFIDAPQTPLLLGRMDFLERFILTIDHSQQRIVLTETP